MTQRKTTLALLLGGAPALAGSTALAQKGETVKIASIDALTGLNAAGRNQLEGFQFLAGKFSPADAAGARLQIVSFDHRLSPQEAFQALQAAIDRGIRDVARGTGTGPATASTDVLNKHNERNPGKVAAALAGLEVSSLGGAVTRRKADQRLQPTVRTSQRQKAGARAFGDSVENIGYNFRTPKTFEPRVASTPTSCQMTRPAGP